MAKWIQIIQEFFNGKLANAEKRKIEAEALSHTMQTLGESIESMGRSITMLNAEMAKMKKTYNKDVNEMKKRLDKLERGYNLAYRCNAVSNLNECPVIKYVNE